MSDTGSPEQRPQSSGDADSSSTWAVRCPCCAATLQVDRRTGKLLEAVPKKPVKKDFDALLADVDSQRQRAEQLFEQERGALEDRERLLDQRFQEALDAVERSTDDDEPERPPHPLDF